MAIDWSEAWRAGRAAWPSVDVPEGVFVEHGEAVLHAASSGSSQGESEDSEGAFHPADLYLACGAAKGDAAAMRELDAMLRPLVDVAVARMNIGLPPEDARQIVRERLFLTVPGPAERRRIADYRGRGRLKNWLRVVIVRTLLNRASAARVRERELSFEEDVLERLLGTGGDVELAYMKSVYRAEFRSAFSEALAGLDARDKNLIRLAFLEKLTIDTLGALHGVHRATAARWIARAELALFEGVRARLKARLGVDEDELASILRLVMSRLEITFETYLNSATPHER